MQKDIEVEVGRNEFEKNSSSGPGGDF